MPLDTCPAWCARIDHWIDDPDDPTPFHHSPDFGPFGFEACDGGPFALFTFEITASTPDELRQVAAHALAAAAWLEAHAS